MRAFLSSGAGSRKFSPRLGTPALVVALLAGVLDSWPTLGMSRAGGVEDVNEMCALVAP